MNLLIWSFIATVLLHIGYSARINSRLSERQIRQNDRGNYRFQLPAYLNPEANARTIYSTDNRNYDGSFGYSYETDNGIKMKQESTGYGANKVVKGYYSYISDGVPYTVNYIADRFGYRAYGAHLPTQPDAVYDQTKFPSVYQPIKNPVYVGQQQQSANYPYNFNQQASLLTQPIYVPDSSSQNYINITPKPNYPSYSQPQSSILPPYNNNFVQQSNLPYAWTTPKPYVSYNNYKK